MKPTIYIVAAALIILAGCIGLRQSTKNSTNALAAAALNATASATSAPARHITLPGPIVPPPYQNSYRVLMENGTPDYGFCSLTGSTLLGTATSCAQAIPLVSSYLANNKCYPACPSGGTPVGPPQISCSLINPGLYGGQFSVNVTYTCQNLPQVNCPNGVPPTYQYLTQWGSAGDGDSQFAKPYGMAINPAGNIIYVSDYLNNRIQEFTLNGQYITQWGIEGSGNGQLNTPEGIAFGPNGNLYVVDYGNNRIQEFTPAGQYITKWGSAGTGNGQFEYPFGIAINPSGDTYVTDTENHRVQEFTATGSYITQWGSLGSGNGQFYSPLGIALDASGNVYVTEGSPNSRVQKFTSNGTYISQFGGHGTGNGQFTTPWGILTTPQAIYITDEWGTSIDRVEEFTPSGQYVTQFGSYGTGNGQFFLDDNIIVNLSGDLYVMDAYNNRIEEFDPTGC